MKRNDYKSLRRVYTLFGAFFIILGAIFLIPQAREVTGASIGVSIMPGIYYLFGLVSTFLGAFSIYLSKKKIKKGQAAMEFLMTYGWAILAAIIAIGALAYFGVFSPERYSSTAVVVTPPFHVGSMSVGINGVKMEILNGGNEPYIVNGISIDSGVSGVSCAESSSDFTIQPGEKVVKTVNCPGLEAGERFKGDISIKYKKPTSSLSQESTGTLSGIASTTVIGEEVSAPSVSAITFGGGFEVGVAGFNALKADDIGSGTFSISIDFNEEMDTGVIPTIVFSNNLNAGEEITNCGGIWTDSDTFSYVCDLNDVEYSGEDISMTISGAKDLEENTMAEYTTSGSDLFIVDTIPPVMTIEGIVAWGTYTPDDWGSTFYYGYEGAYLCEFTLNNGVDWASSSNCGDTITPNDGENTIKVRGTDSAGNVADSAGGSDGVPFTYSVCPFGQVDIGGICIDTANLVAYWKLDETSGTVFGDVMGTYDLNCNNNVGGVCPTYTASGVNGNGAYTFDGLNDYLKASGLSNYPDGKSEISISLWVKYSAVQTNKHVAGWWYAQDNKIYVSSSRLGFMLTGSSSGNAISPLTYNDGIWHHVVGTYDGYGGQQKIYVDGLDTGVSLSGALVSTSDGFCIGAYCTSSGGGAGAFFTGSVDEVMIFDTVLSSDDVIAIRDAQID